MQTILLGWEDKGKWSTTIKVDGGKIVKIGVPHRTDGARSKVIVPSVAEVKHYSKKYAGDMLGAKIGQMTGRKPCRGCKKVEAGINWAHKQGEKLFKRRSA